VLQKLKVLFLCTGNACRSQMAEGWARHLRGDAIEPYSAGIAARGLDPRAVRVMAEAGVDISRQRSKKIEELGPIKFDWVVTLCGEAEEACPVFLGETKRLHRGFPDPARVEGDEEQRLAAFRQVRDQIRSLIEELPGSLVTTTGGKNEG
jgi:arsenate reductase